MRRVSGVLAAVFLLAGVGVWVFRSTTKAPAPVGVPDASIVGLDAGQADASTSVDAGPGAPPDNAAEWKVSPPVHFSSGETFSTVQEAIDAAHPGQVILLPRGVYPVNRLQILEKTDLQLVSEGGPAVFLSGDDVYSVLEITKSARIVLQGIRLEHTRPMPEAFALLDINYTSDVTLRQVYLGPAKAGVLASSVNGLQLEDVLCDEHSEFDLRMEFVEGPVVIRRSLFASEQPVGLFDLAAVSVEQAAEEDAKHDAVREEPSDKEPPEEEPSDEKPPDEEPAPKPEALLVENSSFAGGLLFRVPEGKVTLSRSILVARDSRVFEGLRRSLTAGQPVLSAQVETLTDEQFAIIARGGSLFLKSDSSETPRAVLDAANGAHGQRWPSVQERGEAKRALARAERKIQSSARMWFIGSLYKYPLCSVEEDRSILDKPGGSKVAELRPCTSKEHKEPSLPEYSIPEQQDEWLRIDPGGWVRESQVTTPNMIAQDDWVVPLPMYEARIQKVEPGKLVIEGDLSACARKCPSLVEEDATETEDFEPEKREQDEVLVPEWLPLSVKSSIDHFYIPLCCDDGEE